MTTLTERNLAYGFGLLGGLLFLLAALVSLVVGTAELFLGRLAVAMDSGSEAVVLIVLGGLALLFAYLGRRDWSDRPIVAGITLIAVSLIGWALLAVGPNIAALLGTIFVFLAGLLMLVTPITTELRHAATT